MSNHLSLYPIQNSSYPIQITRSQKDLMGQHFVLSRPSEDRRRRDEILGGFTTWNSLHTGQLAEAFRNAQTKNQISPVIGVYHENLIENTLNACSGGAYSVRRITHFWVTELLHEKMGGHALRPDLFMSSMDSGHWAFWEVKAYRNEKWPLVHKTQLDVYTRLEALGIPTVYFLVGHQASNVSSYLVSARKKRELLELLEQPRSLFVFGRENMASAYDLSPTSETSYGQVARENGDHLKRVPEATLVNAQGEAFKQSPMIEQLFDTMHDHLWVIRPPSSLYHWVIPA